MDGTAALVSRSRGTSRMALAAVAVLLSIGACLVFAALGDRALWDDEAQTAILGRQVLRHGLPMMQATDNLPTDRADRADFNDRLVFTWNTWLPPYLVAASFAVLGESEFAARLPFALAGLLTMLLVVAAARRMSPDQPWYAVLALLLLTLSVPFLLHVRQCRYYAIAIAGTLWMVYGYVARRDERPDWKHIAAGGAICFYSFHIVAAMNGLALLLHALWRGDRRGARELVKAAAAILVVAAPAIVYMRLWSFPAGDGSANVSAVGAFWVFLFWLNGFVVPFPLILLAGFLRRGRGMWLWLLAYALFLAGAPVLVPVASGFLAAAMLAIAILATVRARPVGAATATGGQAAVPAAATTGPGELLFFFAIAYVVVLSVLSQYPFYRYVIPLVPLAALFMARVIVDIGAGSLPAAMAVLVPLAATTAIGALPLAAVDRATARADQPRHPYTVLPRELWRWTAVRADLVSYADELRGSVVDPERCVAEALAAPAADAETVKASYGDISLMYYAPAKRIVSRHVVGDTVPDVMIPRDPFPLRQDAQFRRRTRSVPYTAFELPCANVIWSNNPDPLFHRFRMPADAKRLVIYRRGGE